MSPASLFFFPLTGEFFKMLCLGVNLLFGVNPAFIFSFLCNSLNSACILSLDLELFLFLFRKQKQQYPKSFSKPITKWSNENKIIINIERKKVTAAKVRMKSLANNLWGFFGWDLIWWIVFEWYLLLECWKIKLEIWKVEIWKKLKNVQKNNYWQNRKNLKNLKNLKSSKINIYLRYLLGTSAAK